MLKIQTCKISIISKYSRC